MKKALITVLRDRNATIEQYRQATDQLGEVLAVECDVHFPKEQFLVETPLAQASGLRLQQVPVLIPILRSGLVLLPPFMRFHPGASIGFVGTRRDEKTAIPELYYVKLPKFSPHHPIAVLDPMIATGGSMALTLKVLKEAGALERQIIVVAFIASPEGVMRLQMRFPEIRLVIAQVDEGLDEQKRILPGLGDFGDRYFSSSD